jgi:uncharacterized repeat protein (TIGR03803 family)
MMLRSDSTSSSYRVVYRFGRDSSGDTPLAGLIDVGGKLYGTALEGGLPSVNHRHGNGTVYSVTPKGVETALFRFSVGTGSLPGFGNLLSVNGTFYGTTEVGSASGHGGGGVVYSVTPDGSETVLHTFTGGSDGDLPYYGLTNVDGTLYGATYYGGVRNRGFQGCGIVYSISTSGVEKVLHHFNDEGCNANGGLLDIGGTLYGHTCCGGLSKCKNYNGPIGCGTIFSITTKGVEKVLYSFTGGSDGQDPIGQMVDVNGTLYGTTEGGLGVNGTVFSLSPSGAEKVLHTFAGGSDGASPRSGLTDVRGTLYGTTATGGDGDCSNPVGGSGCGTVYSITTAGVESVLYRFAGGTDGALPTAPLHLLDGVLYGTTAEGGSPKCKGGCGTVFALTP